MTQENHSWPGRWGKDPSKKTDVQMVLMCGHG